MSSYEDRDKSPVRQLVRRAAVIGSGTMGSQIAGLFANIGIPCDLFDLPSKGKNKSRIAEENRQRLLELKPSPLIEQEAIEQITACNIEDDLERLKDADWVIEAIVERPHVKRQMWDKLGPYLKRSAIVSSNTSSISIDYICQALPAANRPNFLGTHFFNPPRYLKLLELIPSSETSKSVLRDVERFGEQILGKTVVKAHDVPGFITNRIGCYGFLETLRAKGELSLSTEEVDAITGPALGRPKSATLRTLDLVGIDIFVDICDHIRGSVTEEWEQRAFEVPTYLRDMLNRGWKGEKVGQGFFRRGVDSDGKRTIEVLDIEAMDYRPLEKLESSSATEANKIKDPAERISAFVASDDAHGRFAWRVLSRLMVYSSWKLGEVTDETKGIDEAMKWGFGWSLGPFETWDALGVKSTALRMKKDELKLPDWADEIAKNGGKFRSN